MAYWNIEKEKKHNLEYFMLKELALNRYFQDKLRVFKKVFVNEAHQFFISSFSPSYHRLLLLFPGQKGSKGFIGVFILC